MFTRIVVGTDGSDTAGQAVDQAIDLARLSGATLGIVSAFQPVPKRRIQGEQEGAPPDIAHEIGPREDVLLVLDADLIVVGNKGMTGARRYLLGSVPNNVSHHAPCSVIIVRTT